MTIVPTTHRAKKLALHIGADASRQVNTMLARQNLTGLAASCRDIPAGAIGCLGGDGLSVDGNLCFFTGLPINGPAVDRLTDAHAAARLFANYDGAFVGVFWDADRKVLVIATDCLGMQPLYMRHEDGELTIVSETKAVQGEPDLAAWGAFLSIGHPIGERSLVSGLKRVPPASILTFDCATHQLDIRRYWEWPQPSERWRDYDFLDALEKDIRAYAAFGDAGTLLLSGGFDSRLLLFLLQRAGVPADALIVAHDDEFDDADGRLAEAVAKLAGIPYRKASPRQDFFSSRDYLDYVKASDVGFPSMDLFIAKVASQIDARAVWDGLVPGFGFMPLHQPEGGFDAYLRQEIRGPDSAIWRAARTLFKPEIVDAMRDGFATDLRAEVARLPQDMYGLARFVIDNRSRNRAGMNPLKVYANWSNAFTPGLSKDFMAHAAIIPFEEKQHGRFYRDLLARLDKRSLAIPFLSGGELMKGNRLNRTYGRERLRIEANRYRTRYPRLFPGKRQRLPEHSSFLGSQLLEADDKWLNPDIGTRLPALAPYSHVTWKLLFHWKVCQWLHEGRLNALVEDRAQVVQATTQRRVVK